MTTTDEAGKALAYLNAAFPRDALEPESAAIWVAEIEELGHAPSALEAARTIGRNGDRFPTLREFRQAYRAAFDRFMAGRAVEAADDSVPPPPEARAMMERGRAGTLLKSIDDLPVSESIAPRPVWARHLRRQEIRELLPPSDAEKHDAILVLRDGYDGTNPIVRYETLLHAEAQRIMDEASAA